MSACFDNYARAAAEPNAARRSFDNEGNLLCPVCIDAQVKYVLPPGIESILQLKVNVQTARALAVQERTMRTEITRIQSIEVFTHSITINYQLLCLSVLTIISFYAQGC